LRILQYGIVYSHTLCTGWRRPIGCLKLQVIFCKRSTNYTALLRRIPYEDKAPHDPTYGIVYSRMYMRGCENVYSRTLYICACAASYSHTLHICACARRLREYTIPHEDSRILYSLTLYTSVKDVRKSVGCVGCQTSMCRMSESLLYSTTWCYMCIAVYSHTLHSIHLCMRCELLGMSALAG